MSDSDKNDKSAAMRGDDDRADDPLFVPHFDDSQEISGTRSGLGPGPEYSEIIESQCGATDDSQPVEQYDGTLGVTTAFVGQHQSAVCQVQWNTNLASIYTNPGNVSGVRWGTGTMISDDIMITCGHLFDQTGGGWQRPRVNGSSNIISPQEIATNMRINFNFQVDPSGNPRPEQSFAILELLEYRLGNLDMAICRIAGNPGSTFGTTQVSTDDAAVGNMICIIGHPAGQPKRIEAGPVTQIDGDRIRYNDIDTLGGNSGSGILRASDGRIVGVHTNGGCTTSSPGPSGGSNFGLRIERFIDVSPTLQRITQPAKLKFRDDLKNKLADDNKLKAVDDLKFKFRDDQKFKFRDDQKLKNVDDVKTPLLDKGPLDNSGGGLGGGPGGLGGGPGGARRPFALGRDHHAAGFRNTQAEELEAAMTELDAYMSELQQMLGQLEEQFRSLEAEHAELTGGGGGR